MFGYVKRNFRKWNYKDKKNMYDEAKKIVILLERDLHISTK